MAEESPDQRRAEEALDEATREVASDELENVEPRGSGYLGFFERFRGKRDPKDERGLRDVLHENDSKE